MANFEAEVMVMAEVITVDVVPVGPVIEVTTITSTISIMVMMMTDQYGPPCALCGGYNHPPPQTLF